MSNEKRIILKTQERKKKHSDDELLFCGTRN